MNSRLIHSVSKTGYGAKMKRQFDYFKSRYGLLRGAAKMIEYLNLSF